MFRPLLPSCLHLFGVSCLIAWVLISSPCVFGQSAAGMRRPAARPSHRHPARHPASHHPVRQASGPAHATTLAPTATHLSLDPIPMDGLPLDYPPAAGYDIQGCDACGQSPGRCDCYALGYLFDWSRSDLWMGLASFSGPGGFLGSDSSGQGQVAGNFGLQEGFNFGTRLPSLLGGQVGSQLGMRFTQTQLEGTAVGDDHRLQAFATAGLFRRVDYGLQGGLVVDYVHDDWVYQADLVQLRGELSFLLSPCHDLGFRFSDSLQTDHTTARLSGSTTPLALELTALNTYRFFYRARFGEAGAGLADLQAGFTEDSAGILAMGIKTPLHGQLGLDIDATYLLPPSDVASSFTHEGWNLSMALVWTPGRPFGRGRDYYRPLFDVAHNGSLIARRLN